MKGQMKGSLLTKTPVISIRGKEQADRFIHILKEHKEAKQKENIPPFVLAFKDFNGEKGSLDINGTVALGLSKVDCSWTDITRERAGRIRDRMRNEKNNNSDVNIGAAYNEILTRAMNLNGFKKNPPPIYFCKKRSKYTEISYT
jgi:hypothetical protein